ncbi:MAG: rhodanese-like domain-containing protein [Myxococcales bacterium]|nr:rhodanese-like domain-containing protein [Myxococcales bacterium]
MRLLGLQGKDQVDGSKAKELVAQGAMLLDVRTELEVQRGAIEGSVNIPIAELVARLGEIPKDRPIIVYCRSGARSARAVQALQKAGWEDVHDLGPMSTWPT